MKFSIIKRAYLWIGLWIILMITSIFLFVKNLNLSKDFTGWIQIQVAKVLPKDEVVKDFKKVLEQFKVKNPKIAVNVSQNITDILIKINVNDAETNKITTKIKQILLDKYLENDKNKILMFSVVGPSFGEYMKSTAIKAILYGLILMTIYLLFAFIGIREYISPALIGLIAIFTMLFDISIPSGAYWILMHFNPTIQVDVIFIIAILTIMWYSINDTIIIFDRVREELLKSKLSRKDPDFSEKYGQIIDKSLWLTMRRSLGTSISTLLVILALYVLWTWPVKLFAFTMGVWVIAGTYSSIFFAAPLAYLLTKSSR